MFVHTVYFWLKMGANNSHRAQLIGDCLELLGKIPTVRHIWAGRPAPASREVIDSSYDVGLTVILDDQAGHDVYQDHPLHLDFKKRNRQNWHKVKVYDFVPMTL